MYNISYLYMPHPKTEYGTIFYDVNKHHLRGKYRKATAPYITIDFISRRSGKTPLSFTLISFNLNNGIYALAERSNKASLHETPSTPALEIVLILIENFSELNCFQN